MTGGISRALAPILAVARLSARDGIGCIKDMTVPGYTHVARRSEKGGDVRAVVGLGKSGKAGNIETVAADPNLAEEVRNYLTYATTYDEAAWEKRWRFSLLSGWREKLSGRRQLRSGFSPQIIL